MSSAEQSQQPHLACSSALRSKPTQTYPPSKSGFLADDSEKDDSSKEVR